ncbi:hypothetical protein F4809DRAFT_660246 [Biscogniauxia mediterranea]|nr:hypothetical protein F4809DRAFT_660246 [Biscogniauxia mediterranea]
MAPKIFLTGATGYIGGEVLYVLTRAHPEYEYAALVRNEERGKPVASQYPNVRLVYGSLEDAQVLEKEAAAADVVLHTANADNLPAAEALARGLSAGHTAARPGHLIHVSGAGVLCWYDAQHGRLGAAPLREQTYDDVADIERLVRLPRGAAMHWEVDEFVLGVSASAAVRAMVVAPPTVYGTGRGPGNRRSLQVPRLARLTLERGFAPVQAPGLAEWDHVHVRDLAAFFVLAVEAALDSEKAADPEIFGPRAYFFVESGAHRWSEVARWVAADAAGRGLIPEAATREVSDPSLGLNARGAASRARKYLGWEPRAEAFREGVAEAVAFEAESMGKGVGDM